MLSFVCGIVIVVMVGYFLIRASQISWKNIEDFTTTIIT
jgi:hypothetical protein